MDGINKNKMETPLEPKNTDDRTMRVIKVFGEDISVLEVLEELDIKKVINYLRVI